MRRRPSRIRTTFVAWCDGTDCSHDPWLEAACTAESAAGRWLEQFDPVAKRIGNVCPVISRQRLIAVHRNPRRSASLDQSLKIGDEERRVCLLRRLEILFDPEVNLRQRVELDAGALNGCELEPCVRNTAACARCQRSEN